MSDINPAADTGDTTSTDTAAADEPYTLHPAWESAMEVVPELVRGPLIEQIRKSERESQKAIETARGGGVAPEWQAFMGEAQAGGINPTDLVDAWNAAAAIREDPMSFARDLNARITELQKSGQITSAQAQQARAEGAAAIEDAIDPNSTPLETAEAKQIRDLQARLDDRDQRETQQQQEQRQATEDYQIQQEADAYAVNFRNELYAQLEGAGYTENAGTLNEQIVTAVGRIAASALEGDPTGTLSAQAAVSSALQTLISISGGPQAVAAAPGIAPRTQYPVGGGRPGVAAAAPQSFTNDLEGKKAREAAMMAEAAKIFANG